MRILIADDEPIARQVLRELLTQQPGTQVVGEAVNGSEALTQVRQSKPDLILLDLQMPELDGFAVARDLQGGTLPLIIFVTAYREHALEAFETGAVDYLLKPVRRERLAAALEKARTHLAGLRKTTPLTTTPRIAGKRRQQRRLFKPEEIIAFQAEREIVYLISDDGRYYAEHSLKQLEAILPQPPFRRVHRSAIINADHIRTVSPLSSRRWLLTMAGGTQITVSKRLTGAIRKPLIP